MKEFIPWIILAVFQVWLVRLVLAGLWVNLRFEKFSSFLVQLRDLPFSTELFRDVRSYQQSLPCFDRVLFSFRGWSFDYFYPDMDARLAGFLGEAQLMKAS